MTTLILILVLLSGCYGKKKDLTREKVVTLVTRCNKTMNKLAEMIKTEKLDVWHSGSDENDTTIDVRVSFTQLHLLKEFAKKQKVVIRIKIANVKNVILHQAKHCRIHRSGVPYDYNSYGSYNEMLKELFHLQNTYKGLVKLRKVGRTYENRTLYVVKIVSHKKPSSCKREICKPIIWLQFGVHAREWISVATGMYTIKKLVTLYGKDPNITNLLDRVSFYVVPLFNADGYEYSRSDVDNRLWRKTRTNYSNVGACLGADANRNWNVLWNISSSNPCDFDYQGTAAESEPCVSTYAKQLRMIRSRLIGFFDIHSYFQLLLHPRSYSLDNPHNFDSVREVSRIFVQAIAKRYGTSYFTERTPLIFRRFLYGLALDYVNTNLNITHAYAVELRDRGQFGFLLPESQIQPTSSEFLDGLLASVDYIAKNSKKVTCAN